MNKTTNHNPQTRIHFGSRVEGTISRHSLTFRDTVESPGAEIATVATYGRKWTTGSVGLGLHRARESNMLIYICTYIYIYINTERERERERERESKR